MPFPYSGIGCDPCQPCDAPTTERVLLWQKPGDSQNLGTFNDAVSVLENLPGVSVDDHTDWSGVIADYKLILFIGPLVDPSWWSSILSGWTGRLHLVGENGNSIFEDIRLYINSKTSITVMSLDSSILDGGCGTQGDTQSAALTVGMSSIFNYSLVSIVTGGTALALTRVGGDDPGKAWIASNKVGTVDWVVSGESNHISDGCPFHVSKNTPFIKNLITVAI